ncbi:MAG: glycosyltransferase [Flavobacteriales bacterium]|nr:glycosyltransferase [Flavobacteriales bacterium]
MPEFSIITPVLNQASTIEKCIESVAMQNVDVEHIIIDGGSTDGTVDIIRKHEDKLAFWVSEPDRGQGHAINKGLKRTTGIWFNWLNADDQLTENALQTVLETAKPDTEVVVGKCRHINEKNDTVAEGSARIWDSLAATLGNYSMGQPSVFYRTETVEQLGDLNENLHLCLDMDLWFRFLLKFGQDHIQTTDTVLSEFLVHKGGKSSSQAEQMRAEKYGIYHALLSNFELPEVIAHFLSLHPIPESVSYQPPSGLNAEELLSNFAWHLMVGAYDQNALEVCQLFFDVVKKGSRLSERQKLEWIARIASAKFTLR